MNPEDDDALGMSRPIARRDFIGGVAVAAGMLASAGNLARAADPAEATAREAATAGVRVPADPAAVPETYPPALAGLRGQYPGSFEDAHRARDGVYTGALDVQEEIREPFDLIVVGAGISGLTCALLFHRYTGGRGRVLILDNHDDFGGHAKRNEFRHDGKVYLAHGGTMDIDTPYFPYSYTARSLLSELGVDVSSYAAHLDRGVYAGLSEGVFFDREHFAGDRLVARPDGASWEQFFGAAPLSPAVRADLIRLHSAEVDYLPGLDAAAQARLLKSISYERFLLEYAHLRRESLAYFGALAFRNNKRIDTCPAFEAALHGSPGTRGLKFEAEPFPDPDFFFHFPDGNATIARLLVNRLVPGAWSRPLDMESMTLALVDYGRLDLPQNTTRIRLRSTVVRVEHHGAPEQSRSVGVTYSRGGQLMRAHASNVILACSNNIIRFIVPALPESQKAALAYASKVPMQYTNVLVRNWRPWARLGVHSIVAPNGYHTELALATPVNIGGYRTVSTPDEPVVVNLVRNPNHPGLPRKAQQALGRQDMLSTPFEKTEKEIRTQMQRILGAGGFDAAKDILGITVNRWPHGYAYTYDTLGDPTFADGEHPHEIGRRRFGRISIANADAGAAAFTNEAMDQAHRAVHDLLVSRDWV